MLTSLSIKNYALIDHLSIQFEKGFSAITGETGAGKSILMGALSIILGKRADSGVLNDKTTKCVIEGTFNISSLSLNSFFTKNDLDYDTITFVRREILPSGKSRAFINDTPVNLTTLRALGNRLVDIHSQHQTLMLANSNFQLEALDGYAGNGPLITSYKEIYQQYITLRNELTTLQQQQYELKKEEDFLNFQFEELDKVALNEEEFKKLEERQQFLSHAEEVMNALGLANSIIEEDEHNLIDRIALIKDTLSSITPFYPKGSELIDRLESIRLELKDMADETAGMLSEGEVNPAELAELTEKRDEIYRMQQKYRASTVGELIALKKEISDQLLGISGVDEKIEKVTKELDKTTKELQKQAAALTNSRKSGIAGFISAIKKVLDKLGMKEAVFEIRLTELNDYTA